MDKRNTQEQKYITFMLQSSSKYKIKFRQDMNQMYTQKNMRTRFSKFSNSAKISSSSSADNFSPTIALISFKIIINMEAYT